MLEPNPIFLFYIRERTRDRQTDRQTERENTTSFCDLALRSLVCVCVCVCTETAENVRNMGRDSGHSENNNGFGSLEPHLFFP